MQKSDLIGRTVHFKYSSETYQIEFLSEAAVRWTRTAGEDVGKGDTEKYVASQLTDDIVVVTWIEADGLGLSNVLDLAKLTVTTHANLGRDVFENAGELGL